VVGWKGTPQRGNTDGPGPRVAADPSDDTRRVRPSSALIRAAGGDPNASRKMSPDSNLVRVVRGDADDTEKVRPSSSLIRASARPDDSGPVRPPPRRRAVPPPSADSYEVDTAYLMQHAFGRKRPRLTLLMIADACLLVVGIYLIVSWTLLPRGLTRADLAPTSTPGTRGYVDWNDNGQPARIATGPVRATFGGDQISGNGGTQPRVGPRPVSTAPPAPDAGAMTRPRTMTPMTTPHRPPPMDPMPADPDAVAQARRIALIVAARDVFLKDVPRRIRGQRKAIHDCYRQTLRLFKNVRGYVDIEFAVGASGLVTSARASRNTTRSKTLGSCISGVFLSTVFPQPPGGPVTLRYPFHFAPRKK